METLLVLLMHILSILHDRANFILEHDWSVANSQSNITKVFI